MSSNSNSVKSVWDSFSLRQKVIGGVTLAAAAAVAGYAFLAARKGRYAHRAPVERPVDTCRDASLFPTLVQIETVIADVRDMFEVDRAELEKVASGLMEEMDRGLKSEHDTILKMLPSYVDKMKVNATGQEVLALDIGGTNFRVMRIQLSPGGQAIVQSSTKHAIPKAVMEGSGTALFDFIATCVVDAVGETADGMPLGFTFSFPVQQHAIDHGCLVEWTKGFTATGVVGEDVAGLLNAAFKRLGRNLAVTAIVNDTVGTLLTGAFETQDESTLVGLILGTGSNACYMESASKITKWKEEPIKTGRMIINIEWGNFGSPNFHHLPKTKFDVELDEASNYPSRQHYEKMLSGMYLGEIVRLVLVSYCADINLFGGQTCSNLNTPYRFASHFMSQIEADNSPDLAGVSAVLKSIGINQSTVPVRQFVKTVCHLVAARSARLAAAGVSAIVQQIDHSDKPVNVAIDGSVFELYPGYQDAMRAALLELGYGQVTLSLAKDGSGLGAALTAAIMGCNA